MVVRQFARAVFADRLIGDELMRVTMARVEIDPTSSSSSVVDVMTAFMHAWRMALAERPSSPALFSDAALVEAFPEQPEPDRLLLLLCDILGLSPRQAADVLGFTGDPGDVLLKARTNLRPRASSTAIVIEDEPVIAADLAGILHQLGIEVVGSATSARQAIEAAMERRPDIILADFNLDGSESGVDAMVQIHQDHDCPVVFVTGYPDSVLQGDEIEPDFVISKPFSQEKVRAAVVHCLDARQA